MKIADPEYRITLKDLLFHARHGVWEQENKIGNEFIVNISVCIPYSNSILEDNLEATISYADLFTIVKEEMEKPRKLLETVAATIRLRLSETWPQIASGSISICKTMPPIAGISGSSEVTLIF